MFRLRIERDQVGNGDEIVLLGAGEAKRKLYEVRLDPQYWYDKAIERSSAFLFWPVFDRILFEVNQMISDDDVAHLNMF